MPRGVRRPSEVFRVVMAQARDKIINTSREAGTFEHKGIRGEGREEGLAEFFREHLPDSFGVATGEAIDFHDSRTGQLDLMIYDKQACAPITVVGRNALIPCEALYVVIEVKTTLTKEELRKSYIAAAKVRGLRPFKKQFSPAQSGKGLGKSGFLRCMYVVFAYATDLSTDSWLTKEFSRIGEVADQSKIPIDCVDRVVVLKRGMINPGNRAGKAIDDSQDDEGVFLEFYLNIVNFLYRECRRRPPVDWQVYSARTASGWVKLK